MKALYPRQQVDVRQVAPSVDVINNPASKRGNSCCIDVAAVDRKAHARMFYE